MIDLQRISLFAETEQQCSWIEAWLERWKDELHVVERGSGVDGVWRVEASHRAAAEVPQPIQCGDWLYPEERAARDRAAVVHAAKAVLAGELALLEGSRRLASLGLSLAPRAAGDPDFRVLRGLLDRVFHLPTGPELQHWSSSALADADAERERIVESARAAVMQACQNLVRRFS